MMVSHQAGTFRDRDTAELCGVLQEQSAVCCVTTNHCIMHFVSKTVAIQQLIIS
jgi:hypothetical protein